MKFKQKLIKYLRNPPKMKRKFIKGLKQKREIFILKKNIKNFIIINK